MTDQAVGSVPRVGLLFDSVSENTGDTAIGLALQQELRRHGIGETVVVNPLGPPVEGLDAVVVGGGELIRPEGDAFYDAFRVRGGTMLNSVGVWASADNLTYLRDYDLVSARSTVEAQRLSRFVGDVQVLPCTTTTLRSDDVQIDGVDDGEPVVGIHVVPHTLRMCPDIVEVINSIPLRKVIIPFTHYNFDDSFMSALPIEDDIVRLPRMDPLQLHAVIRRMSFVVVSSLHASIFAYSQGVPFASAYQEKVQNYFADRELGDFVFRDGQELRQALERIQSGDVDVAKQAERDRNAVTEAFAGFATGILGSVRSESPPVASGGAIQSTAETELRRERILLAQRAHVVVDRDRLVADLVERERRAEAGQSLWHAEADRLAAAAAAAESVVEQLRMRCEALQIERDELRERFARPLGQRVGRGLRAAARWLGWSRT